MTLWFLANENLNKVIHKVLLPQPRPDSQLLLLNQPHRTDKTLPASKAGGSWVRKWNRWLENVYQSD